MRIQPPSPDPSRPGASRRPVSSGASERVVRPGSTPASSGADPGDRVELSAEALDMAASLGSESPPTGAITPEVAARVGERLASGYYDTAEVRDALARRLAAAFGTEGGGPAERA